MKGASLDQVGGNKDLKDLKIWGEPGNSSVPDLVMQNRNLEYGERRCGFDT